MWPGRPERALGQAGPDQLTPLRLLGTPVVSAPARSVGLVCAPVREDLHSFFDGLGARAFLGFAPSVFGFVNLCFFWFCNSCFMVCAPVFVGFAPVFFGFMHLLCFGVCALLFVVCPFICCVPSFVSHEACRRLQFSFGSSSSLYQFHFSGFFQVQLMGSSSLWMLQACLRLQFKDDSSSSSASVPSRSSCYAAPALFSLCLFL